ncbi:hyaluronoglucosaminidase, partial [Ostertagia ostertagi]
HQFRGENISLFYEFNHGRYPYYKHYNRNIPIYGGTPQNLSEEDVKEHLNVSRYNISEYIKSENSSGLGIIDFEEWRPLFELNVYKKECYKLAAIRNILKETILPQWKTINDTAMLEYNETARVFIEQSLTDAKSFRNETRWGLYGFPYCNYNAGEKNETRCREDYRNYNNRMMYIYNASQALYPSIYLKNSSTPECNFRYV